MSNRLKLLRERATRPRRTVPVVTNGELREQIEAVEDALDGLDEAPVADRRLSTKTATSQRDGLLADLDALRTAAEDSTVYLVMQGLSDTAWLALKQQHPPLAQPDEKPRTTDAYAITARFNIDTIRRPLVKACLVGHRERPDADAEVLPLESEFIDWLLDFVNHKQITELADAAYQLCAEDDAVPLPRRRSATRTSDAE